MATKADQLTAVVAATGLTRNTVKELLKAGWYLTDTSSASTFTKDKRKNSHLKSVA